MRASRATARPISREESPSSLVYWREAPPAGPQRGIGFRYVKEPGLPLWLDDDTSGILAEFTVSRGQGTQLCAITRDQWRQLVGRADADFGDPTPGTGPATMKSVEVLDDEEEYAIRNVPIPDTDRNTLIAARRGQGRFRSGVMKLEPRCSLTGVDDERVIVARHTWPWRFATNEERLDPDNGPMLVLTLTSCSTQPHHLHGRCVGDLTRTCRRDGNEAGTASRGRCRSLPQRARGLHCQAQDWHIPRLSG